MTNADPMPDAEVLDDLSSRFLLNNHPADLENVGRFMFLVEEAHWYYEDHSRAKKPLRSLSLKEFTGIMFKHCSGLSIHTPNIDTLYVEFNKFKQTVPVMGAILLDPTLEKCLLVRGYKEQATWGFPRGKLARDESDLECAIREILEETSLDVTDMINEDDFIEVHVKQQRSKLFIIPGVDRATKFAPKNRGEIGDYGWYNIADLPGNPQDAALEFRKEDGTRQKFYMVWHYMRQLRNWVQRKKKQRAKAGNGGGAAKTGKGKAVKTKQALAAEQPGINTLPQDVAVVTSRGGGNTQGSLQALLNGHASGARIEKGMPSGKSALTVSLPGGRASEIEAQMVRESSLDSKGSSATPAATPTRQPGQTWLDFKLDHSAVMQALSAHLKDGGKG